ncbi:MULTISPECIES: DUF2232 domain-containing protein [Sneathiella]|jgi:hypothetical protein|uniref:DUF2232 domain-containing protein n=1 Tax=Sneathiella TaxID=510690 RepID=UPI00146D1A13|nr:DUF2232 domain-containing protein [Sneathiella aquimaris]
MIRDLSFSVVFGIASICILYLTVPGANNPVGSANAFQTLALMTLSTLPLFLSGLGFGLANVSISVLTAVVFAAIVINPIFGVTYVLTCGLPIVFLVRQALLWREDESKVNWYPASNLMVCWVLVCIALSSMALILLYMDDELRTAVIRLCELMLEQVHKQSGLKVVMTAEELVWLMPQFFGPIWGVVLLLSGSLAQGILVRFKKNVRPTPEFSGFMLPLWMAIIAILGLVLSFVLEQINPFLGAIIVALEIAFFLQGMAVIHKVSVSWSYRSLVLTAVYLIVILMFWPALVIALLGLVDSWIGFRSRLPAAPDQEED